MMGKFPESLRLLLRAHVGNCPAGCSHGGFPLLAPIYRSSRRSVTFRCDRCGLQWTMTYHMLAKALANLPRDGKTGGATTHLADALAQIANAVGERRGRQPTRAPDA